MVCANCDSSYNSVADFCKRRRVGHHIMFLFSTHFWCGSFQSGVGFSKIFR